MSSAMMEPMSAYPAHIGDAVFVSRKPTYGFDSVGFNPNMQGNECANKGPHYDHDYETNCTVYVGGVHANISGQALFEAFKQFGHVVSDPLRKPVEREHGEPGQQYAFIKYSTPQEAHHAISAGGVEISGYYLNIKPRDRKQDHRVFKHGSQGSSGYKSSHGEFDIKPINKDLNGATRGPIPALMTTVLELDNLPHDMPMDVMKQILDKEAEGTNGVCIGVYFMGYPNPDTGNKFGLASMSGYYTAQKLKEGLNARVFGDYKLRVSFSTKAVPPFGVTSYPPGLPIPDHLQNPPHQLSLHEHHEQALVSQRMEAAKATEQRMHDFMEKRNQEGPQPVYPHLTHEAQAMKLHADKYEQFNEAQAYQAYVDEAARQDMARQQEFGRHQGMGQHDMAREQEIAHQNEVARHVQAQNQLTQSQFQAQQMGQNQFPQSQQPLSMMAQVSQHQQPHPMIAQGPQNPQPHPMMAQGPQLLPGHPGFQPMVMPPPGFQHVQPADFQPWMEPHGVRPHGPQFMPGQNTVYSQGRPARQSSPSMMPNQPPHRPWNQNNQHHGKRYNGKPYHNNFQNTHQGMSANRQFYPSRSSSGFQSRSTSGSSNSSGTMNSSAPPMHGPSYEKPMVPNTDSQNVSETSFKAENVAEIAASENGSIPSGSENGSVTSKSTVAAKTTTSSSGSVNGSRSGYSFNYREKLIFPVPELEHPDDPRVLYVKNFCDRTVTTPELLKAIFEAYGEVTDVHFPTIEGTPLSQGWAWVTMATPGDSAKAKNALNQTIVGSRRVFVNFAEKKTMRVKRIELLVLGYTPKDAEKAAREYQDVLDAEEKRKEEDELKAKGELESSVASGVDAVEEKTSAEPLEIEEKTHIEPILEVGKDTIETIPETDEKNIVETILEVEDVTPAVEATPAEPLVPPAGSFGSAMETVPVSGSSEPALIQDENIPLAKIEEKIEVSSSEMKVEFEKQQPASEALVTLTNTVIPGATPSEMATDVEANQTVGEPSAPSTPRAFSRSRDRNEPGAISVPNASKNSNVHVAVPSPIHFLTRRPKNNGGPSRIPVQERGTSPVPPVLPKINNQVAATVSSTSVVPIARESGSAASIAPAAPITRRAGSPIPIVPALPRTGRMSPRATSPTGSASSSAGPANPSAGSSKRPSGPGNNPGSANRPTGSIDRSGSANRPTGSVNLQTGPANILTEPDSSPNEAANPPTRPRNDGKKSNTGSRRRGGNRNRGRIAPAAIAAK